MATVWNTAIIAAQWTSAGHYSGSGGFSNQQSDRPGDSSTTLHYTFTNTHYGTYAITGPMTDLCTSIVE